MTEEEHLTISQMCAEFDVTPRTLRFYEYKELLSPVRIGQKRLFTSRDRARLKLILRGKRFGFSLDEIREWLELYELGDGQQKQMTTWVERATAQVDTLKAQRAELDEAIDELQKLIEDGQTFIAENTSEAAQ